ncbi:MAG: nucleotidyltransferase domain-containing protein [Ectothiorhodospiraceae bacterium]|nr:nucleotidyltransferase domain-containing protein [Ectothiorhodospiraceae bacterium]
MHQHTDELRQLAGILTGESDLLFATVFGSMGRGATRPDSDLDIAECVNLFPTVSHRIAN